MVDEVSPSILSSRCSVGMQQRITPTLTAISDYTLRMPQTIASPDDVNRILTSTSFTFQNKNCIIRNRLNSNILEVFDTVSSTTVVDNVGSYTNDTISLVGLQIDAIPSGEGFIKITATPDNQSFITPFRQDVIKHDLGRSLVSVVEVSTDVLN